MSDLRQGRIVWVELRDPQGRNPKVRPAVIITPTNEISPDGDVQVIAITGETDSTPAEVCVSLPWLATGHPTTGLNKPSVAIITWGAEIPVSSIQRQKGLVSTPKLLEIIAKITAYESKPSTPPSVPPPPAP